MPLVSNKDNKALGVKRSMCQRTFASLETLRTRSVMIKQVSDLIKAVKSEDFFASASSLG
jgi:hypothetical protein